MRSLLKKVNVDIDQFRATIKSKLLGELYTNYFYNLYELPIVNARFFHLYGVGEVPGKYHNVIPNFCY